MPDQSVVSAQPAADTLTCDALVGGRVRFWQPREGYRVNVDSLLLADFAARGRHARVAADLGAGVGLLGLLLAHFAAADELVLVEKDPQLVELARRNFALAGRNATVLELGVEQLLTQGRDTRADLVACNPPFYCAERHQPAAHAGRGAARLGELSPFLEAAARLLSGPKARAAFAYPAGSLPELMQAAAQVRLVPKRMRFVHPFLERPARLVLVEFRLARPGGLVVEPPLCEWAAAGKPSPELARLSAPE